MTHFSLLVSDFSGFQSIWSLRERLPDAMPEGYSYSFDLSLPLTRVYQVVDVFRDRLSQKGLLPGTVTSILAFGHIGDGTVLVYYT